MNAEDLVIAFKRDMAKLSGTERRRAIESVRDVIRAAAFDDVFRQEDLSKKSIGN